LDAETIRVLMKEVLASTKHARGWCGSCRKAVTVEIPDAKAVVSAMSDLLVQAKGRPSEASSDDDRVTVIYQVILQDEDGTQRVVSENGVAVGRG
jgi:hypothetical protein